MELYTKESLKEVIEKSKDEFYMPKALFDHYKNLRLETKLAYVSILETMKNKAGYTTENTAYIKVDNPQIQVNLAKLANKEVNQEKVNKYLNEINALFYITFGIFLLKIHAICSLTAENLTQESITRYPS